MTLWRRAEVTLLACCLILFIAMLVGLIYIMVGSHLDLRTAERNFERMSQLTLCQCGAPGPCIMWSGGGCTVTFYFDGPLAEQRRGERGDPAHEPAARFAEWTGPGTAVQP